MSRVDIYYDDPWSPFRPRPRARHPNRVSMPVLMPKQPPQLNQADSRVGRVEARASNLSSGPARYHHPTKHQRSRSASAVPTRSRFDENYLTPVPRVPRSKMSATQVQTIEAHSRRSIAEMYIFHDPSIRDFITRTERASLNATMPLSTISLPGVVYSERRPPTADSFEKPPSTSSSLSSVMTKDSWEVRIRSLSSSQTSFESRPGNQWARRQSFQRPPSLKPQRRLRQAVPNEMFSRIPGEILELILDELKNLHLAPNSNSCATCMMRDLANVALSARKWVKYARFALYVDIQLIGPDSHAQLKRYKLEYGSRLILLRRTLRANPQISGIVHSLKVPMMPRVAKPEDYYNLVASVIMACPNFERLLNFPLNYDHTHNRVFYALSTRERLKEMNWVIEYSPLQRRPRARTLSGSQTRIRSDERYPAPPGDLQPQQSQFFLEHHIDWSYLTSLSIHCHPGASLTPVSLISTAVGYMPALQHLYLANLPFTAFNDATLICLPALKTLSLSRLTGVSSTGIATWASRPSGRLIKTLSLQYLDLTSIPALSRIFSKLGSLESFTLVQSPAPTFPEETTVMLFPYLAAPKLRKLHWDIKSHTFVPSRVDEVLSRSIAAGGFPELRLLRTPNDPHGLFQAVCRPVTQIMSPSDKFLVMRSKNFGTGAPPFDSRERSGLSEARMAAQERLEKALEEPKFFVNVIDEDGQIIEKFGLGGFMGTVGSKIRYHLRPDGDAQETNGGILQITDLQTDGGETLPSDRAGCTGRWNAWDQGDKRDRERWWHTERGRWTGVSLTSR